MSEVGCRKLVVSSSRASAGSVGELRAELAAMGYLLVDSEFAAADFFEGLGKVGRPTQLRSVDRDESRGVRNIRTKSHANDRARTENGPCGLLSTSTS